MSKIEVDAIEPQSGTNLNVGGSGDTVTVPGNVVKTNAVQASDGGNIVSQSGTTITLGASGDTINVASGATLVGGGIEWQSTVVTGATHTASAGQGIWINTTSNACNLTLPASPSVGDEIIFSDFAQTWNTNAVTLTLNGSKFQGNTSPAPVYDTDRETVHIVYSGSTQGWIPISDGAVALETPQTYTADFLCIAAGGGGAHDTGGGGGAGGYRNSYNSEASGGGGSSESSLSLNPTTVYTITIGGGGTGGTGPSPDEGTNGGDSSIAGSGLTTITSVGGGGGSRNPVDGLAGGSGGGGGSTRSGGAGTANQGYAGAAGPGPGAGGGGGAGAAGSTDGTGGTGVSSSIDAAATTRGGGGSGGGPAARPGGAGGGGASSYPTGGGGNGTANTGGGAGGGAFSNPRPGGNGGSGIFILRVPTSFYPGTTTGSPTVTTSGSDTIIKFTGSGSYTA